MQTIKIPKERIGDYPMCPRLEYKGINMEGEGPAKKDFVAVKKQVPGMGEVWLLECQQLPYRLFQVFEATSEAQFDDYLAKLRSMHETPAYVDGRTDFMVLFIGSKEHVELNQLNYKEVDAEILKTQDMACRWWHLYGQKIRRVRKTV